MGVEDSHSSGWGEWLPPERSPLPKRLRRLASATGLTRYDVKLMWKLTSFEQVVAELTKRRLEGRQKKALNRDIFERLNGLKSKSSS